MSLQQFTSDSFAHPKTGCGSFFQIQDYCLIMKPYTHIFKVPELEEISHII